jgi:uncharacterized protein YkwD
VALLAASLMACIVLALFSANDAGAATGGRVPECGGGTTFLRAPEKAMFEMHNKERRARNLPVFCVDERLQEAARAHSEEMIRKDYYSHDSANGEPYDRRLQRFGYNTLPVAENLTGGNGKNGEPRASMNRWMKSEVHRNNILDPDLDEIGIGVATGRWKRYDGWTMYTADFGGG